MKIIINISLLFIIIFSLSCEDKDAPAWINFYDPDRSDSALAEICGAKECGQTDYDGHTLTCGECADEEYCSLSQKCEIRCGENSCGTVDKNTYSGVVPVDCGLCPENEICGTDHTCVAESDICFNKECGNVAFTDHLDVKHQVQCGTCADEEYCSTSLKCVVKDDECVGKCGTITVQAFEGDIEIECGGCTGEFAYCNTENVCDEACQERECGSEAVVLETLLEKKFVCGDCGSGVNYCGTDYKCKVACAEFDCGYDNVETVDGAESITCGECTGADYCDSVQKCKTGSVSGDFIIDENIVIDTVNNFMWQKTNSEGMSLASAVTYCNDLTTDGFSDWILPDILMLRSIISGCSVSKTCGVTDSCADSTCSNADCDGCANGAGTGPQGLYLAPDIWTYTGDANGRFWSSSATPDKADSYWFVRFSNGSVAYNWDGSEYFVRCVRNLNN